MCAQLSHRSCVVYAQLAQVSQSRTLVIFVLDKLEFLQLATQRKFDLHCIDYGYILGKGFKAPLFYHKLLVMIFWWLIIHIYDLHSSAVFHLDYGCRLFTIQLMVRYTDLRTV